jgi:hypothetical protein
MCLLEEKGAVWIAGAALLCRPREGFIRLGRQPGFAGGFGFQKQL